MSLKDKSESLRQSDRNELAQQLDGTGLSQRQLAQRLKTDSRQLQKRRDDRAALAEWTREKDPSNIAWQFINEKYFPQSN